MTATIETRRDAKAGYCTRCRNGQHALCASPADRCGCPSKDHPNRPAAVRETPKPVPGPASPAKAKAAKAPKPAPVWELVKAAPPAPPPKPKKLTPAQQAQPLLEAIVEAGDTDWWRIALFGTPHAAGRVKAALEAEFAEGWEWKAVRDAEGRPAVFVRVVKG